MTDREKELIEKAGLDIEGFEIPEVTQADRTEAQALYTAMMTDTLIEED